MRAVLLASLFIITSLSGCSAIKDAWGDLTGPDYPVSRTPLESGGYATDSRFVVLVEQAETVDVVITATSDLETIVIEGPSNVDTPVVLDLPDGTWKISYTIDGDKYETFKDVTVDTTPPALEGLERVGDAQGGAYTIGASANVEPDETVQVWHGAQVISNGLPYSVSGLSTGLHVYQVIARDPAGNQAIINVQVRAGDAKILPDGQWDFGIVARYTNEARLWDIANMDDYPTPAEARLAVGGKWIGDGYGVTPNDSVVQATVDGLITDERTTMEIAWTLYRWLYDELEYDEERLASNTLMLPRQVIQDSEDPDAEAAGSQDAGSDGLADDGVGNGVKGGVCRDLAATYVSLLRAAGVPARLVSGYLAGSVDGFHAWVEFYGGDVAGNPGLWVPVDVSPVDGEWGTGDLPQGLVTAMQSFGVSLPEYLALRAQPQELDGWSTALSTRYTYPPSSGEPDIRFEKDVQIDGAVQTGRLCFDASTLDRQIATSGACTDTYFDDFVVFTERTIDYGVRVVRAGAGTEVTAELAYPFASAVAPDLVEYTVYGRTYTTDTSQGKVSATFAP